MVASSLPTILMLLQKPAYCGMLVKMERTFIKLRASIIVWTIFKPLYYSPNSPIFQNGTKPGVKLLLITISIFPTYQ